MAIEETNEVTYLYKQSGFNDTKESLFPTTVEEAYPAGISYFERWLKPVLPGLATIVNSVQTEVGASDRETACIFLDRDSRPAMHAWNVLNKEKGYRSLPLPVSSIQLTIFSQEYGRFVDANRGDIDNPEEWSKKLAEQLDRILIYYPDAQKWIAAFRDRCAETLRQRKLIEVIDIGYYGSAVEIARYLLSKAYPDKIVRSALLYKYSDDIPIRAVLSDETTWYAEETIPHTTIGYSLNSQNQFRHLKDPSKIPSFAVERTFYRGIINAAQIYKDQL